MKILEQQQQDKIEIVGQREVKKGVEYVGSMVIHPGQKCWQLDRATGVIEEAVYEKQTVILSDAMANHVSSRVQAKPGFVYCVALNYSTAETKFLKRFAPATKGRFR